MVAFAYFCYGYLLAHLPVSQKVEEAGESIASAFKKRVD
jgi:hypothetical protein